MRRVDLEMYRLSVDALVVPRNARGFVFYFSFDLRKVPELAARDMMKFCPLVLLRDAGRRVGYVDFMIFGLIGFLAGDVDEL